MKKKPTPRSAFLERLREARRDDGGQTLLMVLIIVAVLAGAGAGLVAATTGQLRITNSAADRHAAFAAAESAIQDFRGQLNQVGVANANDLHKWIAVTADGQATNPAECFFITANTGLLGQSGGSLDNEILATITGRGGGVEVYNSGTKSWSCPQSKQYSYSYQSSVVAFKQFNTYLQDAYYSDYEVLDPSYPQTANSYDSDKTVYLTIGSQPQQSVLESSIQLDYSYTDETGATINVNNVTFQQAICTYTASEENTFLDAYGSTDGLANLLASGQSTFSLNYPYYGAYWGQPKAITAGGTAGSPPNLAVDGAWTLPQLTFNLTSPSGVAEKVTVPAGTAPCATPYDFLTGENFSGPVFSQDELHLCGSSGQNAPGFKGNPVSMLTGTPATFYFKYEWPGSYYATSGPLSGHYVPYGYNVDPNPNGGCNTSSPGISTANFYNPKPQLGANQVLPQFNNSLQDYANGAKGTGCLFTGPTMIELVYNGTTETMNVWSPLSKKTNFDSTTPTACGNGQFSLSNAWVTGIAMPADGVVYVQNAPTASTDPNYWSDAALNAIGSSSVTPNDGATSGSPTCFLNPETPKALPDSVSCDGGTLFVMGEVRGEYTFGSAQDVYITRDLSYSCGVTSGTPAQTGLPAACSNQTNPDVVGLFANGDILFSHPVVNTTTNASTCSNATGTTPSSPAVVADVQPTCVIKNAVVDALVVALDGSFGIQNWDAGTQLGGMYLNGSDVAQSRGPFCSGCGSGTGYTKQFNYDTRLSYLAPPHSVQASADNWYPWGYVNCGGMDLSNSTTPACNYPS
jgi:Tfp pilus assembly protein PilX